MKRLLLILTAGVCLGLGNPAAAQRVPPPAARPLGWEEAGRLAARENKLVMVEAGEMPAEVRKKWRDNRALADFMARSVVGMRMDMETDEGREFKPRLLLHPYPAYAFFMPYGDLVGIVSAEELRRNPELLRETFLKARAAAEEKRNNSRSVDFSAPGLRQASALAGETGRKVFVYVGSRRSRASLLMERNVFTLDRVADFYNRHFVCLRLDAEHLPDSLGVTDVPAFVYLTADGKTLYRAAGYCDAERLVRCGNLALEKGKGIPFANLTEGEALREAAATGKLVFTDCHTGGTEHKELVRRVFSDPEVAGFFAEHFVCVSREAGRAALVFSDAGGREVHCIARAESAAVLLAAAERAVAGMGLARMEREWQDGKREGGFAEEYVCMLETAGRREEAARIVTEYLGPESPDCLERKQCWTLFERYVSHPAPGFFEYLLQHRAGLSARYGKEAVEGKIRALRVAGAGDFVREGTFDEPGFRAYVRRLKKEKVEDWRKIARDARMAAAEQLGEWKVYISLAEEKWQEEQVSDAELYRWGTVVGERCRDGNVRYRMAQWLARRAVEMERKERETGRVKMSSYKGFFEKLADDLLKEVR